MFYTDLPLAGPVVMASWDGNFHFFEDDDRCDYCIESHYKVCIVPNQDENPDAKQNRNCYECKSDHRSQCNSRGGRINTATTARKSTTSAKKKIATPAIKKEPAPKASSSKIKASPNVLEVANDTGDFNVDDVLALSSGTAILAMFKEISRKQDLMMAHFGVKDEKATE